MTANDLDLIRAFAHDQSQDAFAALVRRHLDLVYCAALRQVRSPQLAEEVAQSVFTDLARDAGRLKPNTILAAWLYEVTRRTAIDVVRGEARRQVREQIASEMNAMNATASDWTHIEPLLDEAMHALDDADRTAVLLRYFENKSLREVGETLGASEEAARKRISRAVERLREFFAKRGVTVGASGLVVVLSANAVQAVPAGLAVTISTAAALAGTTVTTTAIATATEAIAMTTLQKTLITTALIAAVGTGIYEAHQSSILRTQVQVLRQQQALRSEQEQQMVAPKPLAQPLTNSTDRRFNWESVESTDYKQYIANLRSVGCPEETIRDIIRADVSKLYEGKKKEIRNAAPKFEYWKGEDFIRSGAGREAWIKMFAVNEERDATLRALGIEPDVSKKEAKTAAFTDWMMDYLGEEKKAQVLRLHKELEDRLAVRERNSLNLIQIQQLVKQRDEAAKRLLTQDEAFQYDLRQQIGTAATVRSKLGCMDPTEQEFVAVFKIRKEFEEQFPELFPEVQTVDPAELTAAERRARREAAKQVESQIQDQIRSTLGPERYADYELAQNSIYQAMYRAAKQAELGTSEAKQLYQARLSAEERATLVQNDQRLTPEQRNAALSAIRQETEKSIHIVLGEKAWQQFDRSGNKRWLEALIPQFLPQNTLAPRP